VSDTPAPTAPATDDRRAAARAGAPPRRAVERAAGGDAASLPRPQVIATLAGVLLSLLLAGLDQTIVSTAGPAIQRDLAMAPSLYPWITTAYLVASTVMVPIYGKLSDTYGRKPVLLTAIGIFLLGSVLCGLSPTTPALIAARALQGLGAAGLFTSAFAVIADIFPPAVRGKYTGLVGAVFGVASVVGPLVGGFITDRFGWHWVFFVNVPLGAWRCGSWPRACRPSAAARREAAARPRRRLLARRRGGAAPPRAERRPRRGRRGRGRRPGLGVAAPPRPVRPVARGHRAVRAHRAPRGRPVVDLRLFRSRVVALSIAATFVLGAGFLSAVVFLPLFMVNVAGVSATRAGLTMTPLTLGMVAGSIVSGRVVTRLGRYKKLMLARSRSSSAASRSWPSPSRPSSTQGELTVKMILLGLGMGPTLPLYTLAVQNATPPQDIGVVTAASTFARSLGQVFGVALVGSVFAATLASGVAREQAVALGTLPPGARALLERTLRADAAPAGAAGGEAGDAGGFGFDAARVRRRLAGGPAPRAQDAAAAGGDVGAAAAGAVSAGAPAAGSAARWSPRPGRRVRRGRRARRGLPPGVHRRHPPALPAGDGVRGGRRAAHAVHPRAPARAGRRGRGRGVARGALPPTRQAPGRERRRAAEPRRSFSRSLRSGRRSAGGGDAAAIPRASSPAPCSAYVDGSGTHGRAGEARDRKVSRPPARSQRRAEADARVRAGAGPAHPGRRATRLGEG
jgi:MFS family permease